jgi:hypothetical protein
MSEPRVISTKETCQVCGRGQGPGTCPFLFVRLVDGLAEIEIAVCYLGSDEVSRLPSLQNATPLCSGPPDFAPTPSRRRRFF